MACPNCQKPMKSLTAHSHYDAHVEIDQCPDCGGLWFDGTELYAIKQGLAEVVDKVDRKKLHAVAPVAAELRCPRDNTPLGPFRDRSWPESIMIEICPECQGFWFNRGEFHDWQGYRAEREKRSLSEMDKRFDSQIASLLSFYGTNGEDDSLRRLGDFMATAYGLPKSPVSAAYRKKDDVQLTADALGLVENLVNLFKPTAPGTDLAGDPEAILAKAKFINLALKILAGILTVYFIVSETRAVLGTKLFFSEIDIYIWYFRLLLTFFVLPVFYLFKLLNYLQIKFFPSPPVPVISSSFLQAKMFYYAIYGLLLVLALARWLS